MGWLIEPLAVDQSIVESMCFAEIDRKEYVNGNARSTSRVCRRLAPRSPSGSGFHEGLGGISPRHRERHGGGGAGAGSPGIKTEVRRNDETIKSLRATLARFAITAGAALATQAALAVNSLPGGPAVNQLDLHPPVTKIAAEQQWLQLVHAGDLHGDLHRRVRGDVLFDHQAPQAAGHRAANFHESTTVEIVWTMMPLLIVIAMALPAKVVVAMKDTSAADLTIKATGYQWKWGYDYLKGEGEGIGFLSTLDPPTREMNAAASRRPPTTTC